MGVSAVATLKQVDREDLGGPVFEIEGEDAGLLIGRRGETLKSLQFLVKFIASRKLDTRANLMVDVEGYQDRRYQSLQNLAERVAQRVERSGRPIALEPMPPNERRVVHMALAKNSAVETESRGTGDRRQVVVRPKS
jgi:spoIIIJ-associated protein